MPSQERRHIDRKVAGTATTCTCNRPRRSLVVGFSLGSQKQSSPHEGRRQKHHSSHPPRGDVWKKCECGTEHTTHMHGPGRSQAGIVQGPEKIDQRNTPFPGEGKTRALYRTAHGSSWHGARTTQRRQGRKRSVVTYLHTPCTRTCSVHRAGTTDVLRTVSA